MTVLFYTEERGSPVVFRTHTVARVFMLPLPSAALHQLHKSLAKYSEIAANLQQPRVYPVNAG
jgi:hypothetical protein